MINYPLGPVEAKFVRWTGRLMTILAAGTIVLLATVSLASL